MFVHVRQRLCADPKKATSVSIGWTGARDALKLSVNARFCDHSGELFEAEILGGGPAPSGRSGPDQPPGFGEALPAVRCASEVLGGGGFENTWRVLRGRKAHYDARKPLRERAVDLCATAADASSMLVRRTFSKSAGLAASAALARGLPKLPWLSPMVSVRRLPGTLGLISHLNNEYLPCSRRSRKSSCAALTRWGYSQAIVLSKVLGRPVR